MKEDDVMSMAVRLMMDRDKLTKPDAVAKMNQGPYGLDRPRAEYFLQIARIAVAHIGELPSRTGDVGASTVSGYPSKWEFAWKACLHAQKTAKDGDHAGFASSPSAVGSEGRRGRQRSKNPACFMYGEITAPPFMWGELAGWNSTKVTTP